MFWIFYLILLHTVYNVYYTYANTVVVVFALKKLVRVLFFILWLFINRQSQSLWILKKKILNIIHIFTHSMHIFQVPSETFYNYDYFLHFLYKHDFGIIVYLLYYYTYNYKYHRSSFSNKIENYLKISSISYFS